MSLLTPTQKVTRSLAYPCNPLTTERYGTVVARNEGWLPGVVDFERAGIWTTPLEVFTKEFRIFI